MPKEANIPHQNNSKERKKKSLLVLTDVQVDRSKSLFPEKHLMGKKNKEMAFR